MAAIINNKSVRKMVNVDGNQWEYIEPGVGTSSRLSQHFKRIKLYSTRVELLDKKIDSGTITIEELDDYESYLDKVKEHEDGIFHILTEVYRDGTKDNKGVREWFERTPQWKIEKVFNEIAGKDEDAREASN